MHLILKGGILVGIGVLAPSVVLSLVMISIVMRIILHVVILLVRGVTNTSIVLVLPLVASRHPSLVVRVLVVGLPPLVLVLGALVLSTTCSHLLAAHSP